METKTCKVCGELFSKPADYSRVQWRNRAFCSGTCAEEQKRRTRIGKHRCTDCGGRGPFNTYKTMSGRMSRRGRCIECQNVARRSKEKTERQRQQQNQYAKDFRERVREKEPHRIPHSKEWSVLNPERHLFYMMRKKGRRKITYAEFLKEIGGSVPTHCPILGIKFDFSVRQGDCLPTVDRFDSSKPYEVGNIAIISWRANIVKNGGTADEHRKIADWMDRRMKGDPS